ncbi:hypothetical protein RB2501_06900 [Robiginitalea biformata HTCC2501]|uniref:Uncharacterized protein n=1 Tax=Robiginitalea biformata (strain ATCC BAA-864 / DSM 15991 / KCTC 12146 / HTCC2501) TaxID=313596 RepID=A4CI50_ROBBH|nr:hypothetical protein RB2501_06900 [Robiginitalea biformata HTCC2501]
MTKNDSYPLNIRDFKSNAIFMRDNKIGLSQIVPRVFNNWQHSTSLRIKQLKLL